MERERETYSRDTFDAWLREDSSQITNRWVKVPQAEEPPDYLLHVGTTTFAVEMTSLFFTEFVSKGKRFTQPAVSAMMNTSFSKLEVQLKGKNQIEGFYSVFVDGPLEDYPRYQADVHRLLGEVIERSREQELILPPGIKVTHGPFTLTVYKFGKEETNLGWAVGSEAADDLITEFRDLAISSIEEKAKKLAKITLPKILLLLDETYICDPGVYEAVASDFPGFDEFWGVFVLTVPRGINKFFRQNVFPLQFPGMREANSADE